MRATLQYFDDCPNWKTTLSHLEAIARQRSNLVVSTQAVESEDEADRLRFRGSPTVLLDGSDCFPAPSCPVGLSCRIYSTPDGPAGSPTIDQLRDEIALRS